MRSIIRHLQRHVIAYLALLFALSGTSYAAAEKLLPANSVGTRQVINHSLLRKDFKAGQLPRGPRGLPGEAGPAGPTGPAGPAGIALVTSVLGPAGSMCADGGGACQVASSTATCASGSTVVGGGYTSLSPDLVVPYSLRTGPRTYAVIAINYAATPQTIAAQAICASGPGLVGQRSGFSAGRSFSELVAKARTQVER